MKRVAVVDFQDAASIGGRPDLSASTPVYLFKATGQAYAFERALDLSAVQGVEIDECRLSLPARFLDYRVLSLPFRDREKIMKVIPFELRNLVMEDPDTMVFDAVVLNGSGSQNEVLATYVRKAFLDEILAGLASAGLDPRVITSIELSVILKGGLRDLPERLMHPQELMSDQRIAAAGNELTARTINLRRGPLAYTKDLDSVRKNLKGTVALLIALALALNSVFVLRAVNARKEAASIKGEMKAAYTSLFPNDKRVSDELYQMKSHLKEIKDKDDAFTGLQPLQFLLGLSQVQVKGIMVNEMSFGKDLVTLKAEASSIEDLEGFKAGLSEFLADVAVSDIKSSTPQKVFATVTAKGYRR